MRCSRCVPQRALPDQDSLLGVGQTVSSFGNRAGNQEKNEYRPPQGRHRPIDRVRVHDSTPGLTGHPSWILKHALPFRNKYMPRTSPRRFNLDGPLVTLFPEPQLLGKGSFGSVYCVRRTHDRSQHVMKKISVHNMPAKVPPTHTSILAIPRPRCSRRCTRSVSPGTKSPSTPNPAWLRTQGSTGQGAESRNGGWGRWWWNIARSTLPPRSTQGVSSHPKL